MQNWEVPSESAKVGGKSDSRTKSETKEVRSRPTYLVQRSDSPVVRGLGDAMIMGNQDTCRRYSGWRAGQKRKSREAPEANIIQNHMLSKSVQALARSSRCRGPRGKSSQMAQRYRMYLSTIHIGVPVFGNCSSNGDRRPQRSRCGSVAKQPSKHVCMIRTDCSALVQP